MWFCVTFVVIFAVAVNSDGNGPRIMRGKPVAPGEAPYVVEIRNGNSHWCGGSIVHPSWVLTAAHCLDDISESTTFVIAGAVEEAGRSGQRAQVARFHRPPQHDPSTLSADVALLQLAQPLTFTNNVRSIKIGQVGVNQNVQVFGWGAGSGGVLKKAELQTISKCDFSDGFICADGIDGDTCSGDSGGPVVKNGQLVALVTGATKSAPAGTPQCDNGIPGLYTRLSNYKSWITQMVGVPV